MLRMFRSQVTLKIAVKIFLTVIQLGVYRNIIFLNKIVIFFNGQKSLYNFYNNVNTKMYLINSIHLLVTLQKEQIKA